MAETIITSETPLTSSQFTPPSRIICRICQKQFSQYTCPRCNTRYCSLQCYKSHSVRCTESFMRENVVEELRQLQPGDNTKQKMMHILERFHLEEERESMDEDDSTLSEDTIQKILSGHQIGFDDLSVEEKKRFQRAVASGELSKLIEPWDPWWLKPSARTISLSREGTQFIQPLVNQESVTCPLDGPESHLFHDVPPGPETPLPLVIKLSSIEPPPPISDSPSRHRI
ncbi:hypothetical protein U1Q18_036835 [Sarracenia purpurea var. burkii]